MRDEGPFDDYTGYYTLDKDLDSDAACRDIPRDGQMGCAKGNRARHASTSRGDYFSMDALACELHQVEPCW